MIFFYSGDAIWQCQPEAVLKDKANLMLTFQMYHKNLKGDRRFREVVKARNPKKESQDHED